jgi:hypothetical protein
METAAQPLNRVGLTYYDSRFRAYQISSGIPRAYKGLCQVALMPKDQRLRQQKEDRQKKQQASHTSLVQHKPRLSLALGEPQ